MEPELPSTGRENSYNCVKRKLLDHIQKQICQSLPTYLLLNATAVDRLKGIISYICAPNNLKLVEIPILKFEIDSQIYKVKVDWNSLFYANDQPKEYYFVMAKIFQQIKSDLKF